MNLRSIRRRPGSIQQIGRGLGTLDREVFEAIAESPSPLLDAVMPRLTRAADHSKLWLVIAGVLVASGRPSARARRHPRRRQPGRDEPVHQPGGQARSGAGRARTVESVPLARRSRRLPDVELAAVGPFGQRGGLRGRRRAGKSAGGPGPGAAGGSGRNVPGRNRGALPRRRARRFRHRRRDRRARRTGGTADRRGAYPRRRSAAGRYACPPRRRRASCW